MTDATGDPAAFPAWAWASGEESSDPLVHHDGTTTRVDELGGTGHLERMEQDCADVAGLGCAVWRYGMPWQRTEVAPGVYDWSLWDRALAAAEAAGLEVVVDLCHFGLPDHLPGFCDPSWVDAFGRYVDAFLARYPGPRWFTPVNEPTTTAFCSALWGAWNDGRSSSDDFARALVLCQLADAEAAARIRADRPAVFPGAEALSIPAAVDPDRADEAELELLRWFAAFDLRSGHEVDPSVAPMFDAVPDAWLERLAAVAGTEGVVAGHDLYPVSVQAWPAPGRDPAPLSIEDRIAAWAALARRFADRYDVPVWVAETSNLGLPVDDGPAWLAALAEACGVLRAEGVDVRGICWYSRGDQLDWDHALVPPAGDVTTVGLFDLARRPRPVAATYAALARTVPGA